MLRGLLAFALIASTGLAAQDRFIPRENSASQTGTSVIRGRIVSAANGEPLRKARVSLSSRAAPAFPAPAQPGTSGSRGRSGAAANGEPRRKARGSLASRAEPCGTDNEGRGAGTK